MNVGGRGGIDARRSPRAARSLAGGTVGVVLLAGLVACRSAPEHRPATPPAACEPEVRLMRRPVELVPLVATSPPLDATVLSLVRRQFEDRLTQTGVFEIVNGADRPGELIIGGVISDVGSLPETASEDLSVEREGDQLVDWSLRLVVEVRAKADNHLIAVVGATAAVNPILAQPTGAEIEQQIADARLRQGLLQVVAEVARGLAARFGAGASFQDPAALDNATLIRLGSDLYAAGAYFDAEAQLRTALEREAGNAQVASLLGDIYYSRRDYVGAVQYYNAAIDVESTRFHDLALLGNAYFYLRDYERAEKVWGQALRLDAKSNHAKTLKANLRQVKDAARKRPRGRGLGETTPERPRSSSPLAGDEF